MRNQPVLPYDARIVLGNFRAVLYALALLACFSLRFVGFGVCVRNVDLDFKPAMATTKRSIYSDLFLYPPFSFLPF